MEKYSIKLVTRMRMYNGQKIKGCCGDITTEYFIFNAHPDEGPTEIIIVGSNCGRQFIKLLDEKMPPLFNALKAKKSEDEDVSDKAKKTTGNQQEPGDSFEKDEYRTNLTPLNLEVYNAIHLIVSCWGGYCTGALSEMINYLRRKPDLDTTAYWLKVLNNIIKKDSRNRGLVAMAATIRKDNPDMEFFRFPLMEKTLKENGEQLKL